MPKSEFSESAKSKVKSAACVVVCLTTLLGVRVITSNGK